MSNISGTEIVLIETCITIIIWLLVIYHTLYNDRSTNKMPVFSSANIYLLFQVAINLFVDNTFLNNNKNSTTWDIS